MRILLDKYIIFIFNITKKKKEKIKIKIEQFQKYSYPATKFYINFFFNYSLSKSLNNKAIKHEQISILRK